MKILIAMLMALPGFILFDLNLFRRKIRTISITSIESEYENKKEKLKRIKRSYVKGKYKKKGIFREKNYKFKSSRAKDARYSSQRKLRRMFRNG